MVRLLKLVVVMVVVSTAATSHPFGHTDPSRHTDFEWNSRKIGTRRVATIRIRKDEERDRRSIFLGDDDDDEDAFHSSTTTHHHESVGGHGRRRHAHRHHHGDEAPDTLWLTPEEPEGKTGRGRSASQGRHRGQGDNERGLSPRHISDSRLDNRDYNDIQPEDLSRLIEARDDAGINLGHYLVHNVTTSARPRGRKLKQGGIRSSGGGGGGGRKRTKNKNKKNKKNKKKKKPKKGGKKKGSKACRGLKGRQKKKCRSAFKKCRQLRGRERKRCRAEATKTFSASARNVDVCSFSKSSTEMRGSEACQYHHLGECCRTVGMLSHGSEILQPVVKCHYREEFLKCMEEQREGNCDPSFHISGNMTALRNKIREVIWTNNSCLISEVEEG